MDPEYKVTKEASVSYLNGGGKWEINHVTAVAPAAYLLWSVLQSRQNFFKSNSVPALLTDFLLQCGAILFATTIYSDAPQVLLGLIALPSVATLLQGTTEKEPAVAKPPRIPEVDGKTDGTVKGDEKEAEPELDPLPTKPFITAYRGAMMIITCTSILAVDFPVFPRRFAKTEEFGTSLMDLGVGSFVFASGIVSARQMLKEELNQSAPTFFARMKAALRHSLPLAVLGFIRLYSIKSLDYAEHVSEYGVHWNFFFTLALLSPAVALLQPVLRLVGSLNLLAFIIGIIYEINIYFIEGLDQYILLAPRVEGDWLSQNREGVFSFIGYLAIFICGMGAGQHALPRDKPWDLFATRPENVNPLFLLQAPPAAWFGLAKWTAIWFVISVWAFWRYGPDLYASRRMANLGYIIWVCGFNTAQLLLFSLIEKVNFPSLYFAKSKEEEESRITTATSKVLHAFNRNGLAVFLLANLLTGAINLKLKTWFMEDTEAMAVLIGYIAVVTGTAVALDHFDVSIKL
ncbi:GPI-anchored wall transfer protein 1 [Polychaeton citri CBS 116435]|uniref:GPI-anchored wall transfer protein n=1 Tax=Polychaeton citri CBS 116435 TaxID=1314669 RepID=A0A9P4Q5B1_9PEZI|nr:GPI-anchored wall transfer protein 1 [Polychaeton citri CBS 116435]